MKKNDVYFFCGVHARTHTHRVKIRTCEKALQLWRKWWTLFFRVSIFLISVLSNFMLIWHGLESFERQEPQLRKCFSHQIFFTIKYKDLKNKRKKKMLPCRPWWCMPLIPSTGIKSVRHHCLAQLIFKFYVHGYFARWDQNRALNPQDQELKMFVSHCLGAKNWTWLLYKNS